MALISDLRRVLAREGWRGLRHRLRHRARLLRYRARASAASCGSHYGVRLVPNWGDATFRMYVAGSYGDFYADYLRGHTDPFVFLDVGANQGLYTIIAAANPACAQAVAFEPVPQTAALLRRNLALNPGADKVQVIEAAVSDRAGPLTITTASGHSGAASLGAGNGPRTTIQAVDAKGLSQLDLPADLPIIAKLDVEGHEAIALGALLDSAHGARLTEIYYECDEDWVDPAAIEALLAPHGFARRRRIGGARHYNILADRSVRMAAHT